MYHLYTPVSALRAPCHRGARYAFLTRSYEKTLMRILTIGEFKAQFSNRVLKNVARGRQARKKPAKKRSLHRVNEHFEPVFDNASRPRSSFSTACKVLTAVQAGESGVVGYGRKKQRGAALTPDTEFAANAGKRPLGLLQGKGSFTLHEDFALSDDEFLAA